MTIDELQQALAAKLAGAARLSELKAQREPMANGVTELSGMITKIDAEIADLQADLASQETVDLLQEFIAAVALPPPPIVARDGSPTPIFLPGT